MSSADRTCHPERNEGWKPLSTSRIMNQARSILLAVPLVAASVVTLAAQEPDTVKIAPLVVTATRVPISVSAAPATVAVITGDELRLRGVTSVSSALQTLPGVSFSQSGSFGSTTTLFLRGGESKYVKVLVDGVPVNDPGGAMDFSWLTTDNVERIELVRGPASVLYGADAVTGVIQIFTRRGSGAPRTIVSGRGGSYGSSDADGTVLGTIAGGSGDFSISLARHDTRGIYKFNNTFHNTVVSGGLHLLLTPQTDLRLSVRYGDDEFHYPTNGGGEPVDSNAHQTQDRTTLAAELGHYFSPRVDARLSLTSQETSGGTDNRPDSPGGSGSQSVDRTRRRGVDLRSNLAVVTGTVVTVGVQAEQQDQRTENISVFGTSEFTSTLHASRRNRAVYGQVLAALPDSIVLTAGARNDHNERFGNFGTYRLGGSWRVIGGTHLRASTGTAFREPSFFENYATGFVTGNQELRPEHSTMWELGVQQALLGNRVTVGVTEFDQRFRDMIDYTGSTGACGASYCNVARARAAGREFEAHVAPSAHLSLDANLTHLETKVLKAGFDTTTGGLYHDNEQLIRRPTTTWNGGVSYVSRRGSIDARVTHAGRRTDRDFRPYPAEPVVDAPYTRLDLGAILPLAVFDASLARADLTLHVENLFNARYESAFNFLSPGRTVLAGARLTF
jgi:vitamin B12 transporter